MAMSINPAVSGSRRRFYLAGLTYLVGVFLGAALTVAILFVVVQSVAGEVAPLRWLGMAAVVAITWVASRDLGTSVLVPYRNKQVPERFRGLLPPSAVAGAFGFQLGTTFLTRYTNSAPFAALVGSVFLPTGEALAVLAAFAFGKTIVLAVGRNAATHQAACEIGSKFFYTRVRGNVLAATVVGSSLLVAVLLLRITGWTSGM